MQNSTSPLLFVLLLLPGCAKDSPPADNSPDGKTSVAFDPSWQTPTEEEASQWAKALEAAVKRNDTAEYNALVDWGAVLVRGTAGIPCDQRLRRVFVVRLRWDLEHTSGIGAIACREVARGGRYQFLRIRTQDSRRRALFRLNVGRAGGFNYHDYLLAKKGGQVRAVDCYVFVNGELFSETARNGFLPLITENNNSFFATLRGEENDYWKHIAQVNAMGQFFRNGEMSKGVALFNELPTSVQRRKSVLLMYVIASQKIDKQLYQEALKKFATWFPDDPALSLMLIDGYALSGEFDKVHRTIDRLDQAVGGDPYLQTLHCGVYCKQKQFADGEAAARKAIAADPTMQAAYDSLIHASLEAQDFSATTDALIALEQKFSVKLSDLRSVPEYTEYVKSADYQRWLKSHDRPAAKPQ
jgi:hypothetical protein